MSLQGRQQNILFHIKNERLYSNQGKGEQKKDKKNP